MGPTDSQGISEKRRVLFTPAENPTTISFSGFGGLEVACWPLVHKFESSNPAEVVGFFRALLPSLRKGSKAVCPMSHICGKQKNPKVYAWKSQLSVEITGHFSLK